MTFLRYLIIQVLAYGIDMSVFACSIHFLLAGPIISNILSKLAAGCFAFMVHRSYTFNVAPSGFFCRQAIRYFTVLVAYVPVASGVLAFILLWVPQPVLAKFVSDVLMVGFSYIVSKKFIFKALGNSSTNSASS